MTSEVAKVKWVKFAFSLVMLIGICVAVVLAARAGTQPTYQEAKAKCLTSESSPWDASACEWQVYEKFFGTDKAEAAWADALQKVGK